MKALVTGGGGFLGQAVVERLRAGGHRVTALGRSAYPVLERLGVPCVRADVADAAAVARAAAGHDAVVHVAAKAGVWGDPAEFHKSNVVGTRNVIDACRAAGIRRLVFTSSPSAVFDGQDHEGAAELPYPPRHETPYAATKAAAEREVLAANGPELATVALRPHLIYGPADPHILPRVIDQARSGRLRVVGSGRNRVGLTFVANAAEAHANALERLAPGAPLAGRAYFVTDAEPVVLWEWVNGLLRRLGVPEVRRRVPLWAARAAGGAAEAVWRMFELSGEPPMTRFVAAQLARAHWYDLGPARRDLGYEPVVGPEEALDRTVAHFAPQLGG